MAQNPRYRPRHLGDDNEDPDSPETPDQEDRGSCREGCDHLRERETLCWAQESACTSAWPRSRRVTLHLPAEPQGEDQLDEGDGSRVEHVLGLGQRVQVWDWAPNSRAARHEAQVLRAEETRANAARGTEPHEREAVARLDWTSATLHWRRFQPRHLSIL